MKKIQDILNSMQHLDNLPKVGSIFNQMNSMQNTLNSIPNLGKFSEIGNIFNTLGGLQNVIIPEWIVKQNFMHQGLFDIDKGLLSGSIMKSYNFNQSILGKELIDIGNLTKITFPFSIESNTTLAGITKAYNVFPDNMSAFFTSQNNLTVALQGLDNLANAMNPNYLGIFSKLATDLKNTSVNYFKDNIEYFKNYEDLEIPEEINEIIIDEIRIIESKTQRTQNDFLLFIYTVITKLQLLATRLNTEKSQEKIKMFIDALDIASYFA